MNVGYPPRVGPGLLIPCLCDYFLQNSPCVALDPHFHRIITAQFLGVDFDLDDAGVRRDVAVVIKGGRLAEPGSSRQDNVGLPDGLDALFGSQPAQVPQEQGMVAGDGVGAAIGRNHRSAKEVSKLRHFFSRVAPLDAPTGHYNGAFGG